MNGRTLKVNLDNECKINEKLNNDEPVIESLLDQRNPALKDNKKTISIEMFHNPNWIKTLQLSQTIMPLQNTIYNDIPD